MSDEIKARQRELSGQAQNELRPYRTPDDNAPEAWMATGVSVGLLGAGVLAASAVCPPCLLGAAPLALAAAPGLVGVGLFKRWRRRQSVKTDDAAADNVGE